jgi:hypothetical protein
LQKFCQEICGDDIDLGFYMCDLGFDIPYDGCTNECAFMSNFTCYRSNNQSICSYNGTLSFKFISYKIIST